MKSKVEELFEKLAQSEGSQVKWQDVHPMMQQQFIQAVNVIRNIVNTGSF